LEVYVSSEGILSQTAYDQIDELCANVIRGLAMDGVQTADSGHPGMPMGMATVAHVLWTRFLRHNSTNPRWFNRDRFVLSGGHGSMLLYSLLHLAGYGLPLDQLKQFRQLGSLTPGHPEYGVTVGVETTTGPLGQPAGLPDRGSLRLRHRRGRLYAGRDQPRGGFTGRSSEAGQADLLL
jgi:transketolase